ncbi:hypothetical protein OG496_55275 [Streptomyces sp. NBC_00988]|uniref:hypothetical protein n=1 Tax=Streptomyces sp. NBC_00988 TaxID=2903704 RepID=UPI003867EC93|nr:hypothetical protein OG496_00010 [Streptomyces sp. NBC_00988]WSX17754.1 hypothetical protein OG496_55275 [Streptomyces sp. NBC_00988]
MTAPRIPDVLNLSVAGLTAIGDAPLWVALAFVLPSVLTVATRSFNEALIGISRFRTEAVRRQHEDRLLSEVTDAATGLGHLQRMHQDTPAARTPTDDPGPSSPPNATPPPASPP